MSARSTAFDAPFLDLGALVCPGQVVLELGRGVGQTSLQLAREVGTNGRVIVVDTSAERLARGRALATEERAEQVRFVRARMHDLYLDLDAVDRILAERPVDNAEALSRIEVELDDLRRQPAVPDGSVDVALCVDALNLLAHGNRADALTEIHRSLRKGGRLVLSEWVSDEHVPARLRHDEVAWSRGLGGAYSESQLLVALEEAGFYGISVEQLGGPEHVVANIEFRRARLHAYKGKEGPCFDQKHAVIYRGPFSEIQDDDGHAYRRGVRTAVCGKTFDILSKAPYREHFELIEPVQAIPLEKAPLFPCSVGALVRDPRETKGLEDIQPRPHSTSSKTSSSGCC
jgi:ubiquinone/menaquinone biosynthesis C-methylase UbiE